MANEINLNVDASVLGTPQLEKLRQYFLDSVKNAKTLESTLRDVNGRLREIAIQGDKAKKLVSDVRSLSMGTPASALANAATRGRISDINSGLEVRQARELNAAFGAVTQQMRAFSNEMKLNNARSYQTGQAAAGNAAGIRAQIQAAQMVQSQAYMRAQASPRGMNAEFGKIYKEATADIERLNRALTEVVNKEKQVIQAKSRSAVYQERIAQKEAEIAARMGTANQLEMARLQLDRQKLVLKEAYARSEGRVTDEIRKQLAIQSQMKNQMRSIEAENKIRTQRESRDNLVNSDGGASLFKVQAALLVNYMLMNQVFQLFNFGRQYVIELDKTFRDLQAIIEATDTGMEGLRETIIRVSQDTRFSAVEVAKAAVIMGQAGMSLDQIDKSIGAVTMLATATGSDLTQAVEVSTSVLSVFNLRAEEMTHVANVMTGALNLSKLSIDKLALGIQYAGNIAADSGASFEELVAALGAIANAGIKSGSTMGTGLRQLLTEFLDPSDKFLKILNELGISVSEVDVKTQGLTQVFRNLNNAGFTTAEAFKALDIRAAAAYSALSKNLDLADRMEQSFLLTNAAVAANEVQMKSFSNTLDRFTNILGVAINNGIGPLTQMLRELLDVGADVLQFMNTNMPGALGVLTTAVTGLVALFVVKRVGGLISNLLFGEGVGMAAGTAGILNVGKAMGAVAGSVIGVGAAAGRTAGAMRMLMMAMGGWVGIISTVLTVGTLAWAGWASGADNAAVKMDKLKAEFDKTKGSFDETDGRIASVDSSIGKLIDRYSSLAVNGRALETMAIEMRVKFGELGLQFDENGLTVDKLIESLRKLRGELRETSVEQARLMALQQGDVAQTGIQGVANNLPGFWGNARSGRGSAMFDMGSTGLRNTTQAVSGYRDSIRSFAEVNVAGQTLDQLETLRSQVKSTWDGYTTSLVTVIEEQKRLELEVKNTKGSYKGNAGIALDQIKAYRKSLEEERAGVVEYLANVSQQMDLQRAMRGEESENTELNEQLTRFVEDYRNKLGQIQEQLMTGQIRDADGVMRDLTKEEKADLSSQRDAMKKLLEDMSTMTVEQMLNFVREKFPAWLTGLSPDGEEAKKILGDALPNVQVAAAGVVTDANNAMEKAVSQLQMVYADLVKKNQYLLEQAGQSARQAADRLKVEADRYGYIESESGVGGGLNGVYSPAQLQVLAARRKQTEIAQMEQERNYTAARVAQMEANLGSQRAQAGGMRSRAGNDPNNATSADLLQIEKDLSAAERELAAERNKLVDQTNRLAAANGTLAKETTTMGEELSQVIKNYAQENNWHLTTIRDNLDGLVRGTLYSAQTEFSGFFKSIMDGTESVGGAFKKMASGILNSMLDLMTQLLAEQILGNIFGGLSSAFGIPNPMAAAACGPVRKAGGGYIRAANGRGAGAQRDSVHALLRPGEFVMRNSAVDAIGLDNLAAMNAAGNRKIQSSAANMPEAGLMAPSEPSVVNVWIVPEQQQAGLGPKDVIAIMHKDMLHGKSKQLIKQVQT